MDLDLRGRVGNLSLGPSGCLLPVFEAIANSVHAIEDAPGRRGSIVIRVLRDESQGKLGADWAASPITGFEIEDNGVGFTSANYKSFNISDTTHKADKGGKGVGRLLWLKAFARAATLSTFCENDKFWTRSFSFSLDQNGVSSHSLIESDTSTCKTTVTLSGFEPKFAQACPKTAETIGRRVIEHFVYHFARVGGPKMEIIDGDTRVDLGRLFKEEVSVHTESNAFQLKNVKFKVTHVLFASPSGSHRLHFCANSRTVTSNPLSSRIPNLPTPLRDPNGRSMYYSGYISSTYLDERKNSERTSFSLCSAEDIEFEPEEITEQDLTAASLARAGAFLEDHTETAKKGKEKRIEDFVQNKAPQYRPLLKHRPELIDSIALDLPEEKLDVELYRLDQQYDAELRVKYTELLTNGDKKAKRVDELKLQIEQFLDEWNEAGAAKLAKYVAHRKAILAFLEDRLGKADGDKYALEESIHQVIFPLKTTSDDVRPDRMNLWVLDEKLAFHFYLASDKQLNQIDVVESIESKERPDLLIFNRPFAYVEGEAPFGSIVLVEFKRPERNDYDESENPVTQVLSYAEEIQAGKTKDRRGKTINIPPKTPFHAFILCSITPRIRRVAKFHNLDLSPDGQGFHGYNAPLGVFVEIVSYERLISDAKKRNLILFRKLGIDPGTFPGPG